MEMVFVDGRTAERAREVLRELAAFSSEFEQEVSRLREAARADGYAARVAGLTLGANPHAAWDSEVRRDLGDHWCLGFEEADQELVAETLAAAVEEVLSHVGSEQARFVRVDANRIRLLGLALVGVQKYRM